MTAEARLEALVLRWQEMRAQGRPVSVAELCRDCPELAAPLRRRIAALQSTPPGFSTIPPVAPAPSDPPRPATGTLPTASPPAGAFPGLAPILRAGAEPVPGYRLERPLGRGGFGEVWRAQAPGGFAIALKFIRLTQAADVEARSLEVMKDIRHPHLLPMFGAWKLHGHLIVALELAAGTLMDRLSRAKEQGLPGVPPRELVGHLRDAAEGLDYLNELAIQHRDVKPQNLLLVGGRVKVGDFGLAKLLEHTFSSNTGSMTAAYAAPECFHGRISPQSDQYSLAVTYCQLRGGRLPFTGDLARVMHGHLMEPPDLDMLPAPERPAAARALAKEPRDRWPSCRAFVQALEESSAAAGGSVNQLARRRRPLRAALAVGGLAAGLGATAAAVALLVRTRDPQPPPPEPPPAVTPAPSRVDRPPPRPDPPTDRARPPEPAPPTARKPAPPPTAIPTTRTKPPLLVDKPQPAPTPPRPAPHLDLAPLEEVRLQAGATASLTVRVHRRACPGEVQLRLEGLPEGITARPHPIAGDAEQAALDLTASAEMPSGRHVAWVVGSAGTLIARQPLRLVVHNDHLIVNSAGMKLARIDPGEFVMGSPPSEPGRSDDEEPHKVVLSRPFYLGRCEVTRGQFKAFVQDKGYRTDAEKTGAKHTWRDAGFAQTDDHPVVWVSWRDAVEFCDWLSQKEGNRYRLPTEAEWEYACRAGSATAFSSGDGEGSLRGTANLADASLKALKESLDWNVAWDDGYPYTAPVGRFKANAFGLYDMHGNVWEWCADRYQDDYYHDSPPRDPRGPQAGDTRVLRGGSFYCPARFCRAATRRGHPPEKSQIDLGFRIARDP